jgi:hypothetical protein
MVGSSAATSFFTEYPLNYAKSQQLYKAVYLKDDITVFLEMK